MYVLTRKEKLGLKFMFSFIDYNHNNVIYFVLIVDHRPKESELCSIL